ncbi:hypothetical protein GCM10009799_31780 [Nocardiopsis rhodophaea]|uniref:MFS transporter n=1 Tax=Nocardiopsis rhodophaea TaxID=280238 RepID=A0ABN2T9C4_9ACTN
MALLNVGAGAAAFVGPAVASLLLGPDGPGGVVVTFAVLYVIAAVMTRFLTAPGDIAGTAPPSDRAAETGAAPVSAGEPG